MLLKNKLPFWIALNSYVEAIVSGVPPLSLTKAKNKPVKELKAFGGTEQRNLPDNYIERQFIYMMDGSYLAVGNQSITSDYKIEFDFATTNLPSSLANYFGARASGVSAGGGFRVSKLSNQGVAMYGFDTTDAYESGANVLTANTRYKYVYENGTCTISSGGTNVITHTYTINDTSTITAFGINAYTSNGTTYAASPVGIYCYGLKLWNGQGELVMNLVPVVQKGTVPVVGFYDTVSETFMTATSGTFAAGAEAVPTPDYPMDIICNNGVLKARHQSGLPLGYTLLDYIESTGTQYIDTGLINNSGAITATAVFSVSTFDGMTETYAAIFGRNSNFQAGYTSDGKANIGNATSTQGFFTLNTPATVVGVLQSDTAGGYTIDGVSTGLTRVYIPSTPLYIFAAESNKYMTKGKMYSFTAEQNGQIIMNLVPAKNSSNVVGMYDTVSGQFFTNAGTGNFTAGNVINDIEVYADGTQETINIHTKNLFDEQWNRNTGVSTQTATWGQVVYANGWSTSGLVPVKAGQQYTVSYNTTTQLYVFYYESDGTMQQSYDFTTATKKTFTVPAGATHIRLQVNKSTEAAIADLKTQLETGATATTHVPYFNGGTAVAEMLLSIGTYTDEQEVISGGVTRKVGIKVMTGNETFQSGTNGWISEDTITDNLSAIYTPICTHFAGTDTTPVANSNTVRVYYTSQNVPRVYFGVDKTIYTTATVFQQYLADQYAAGTPVIIVYPLATAATETVTGQPMSTTDGDNIAEITQASMDGLELSVKYIKGA